MNNYIQIEKYKLQQWIEELTQYNSLMLTISEPHAKIKRVLANGNNLEPVIDQIIKFVNRYVFGKHKRFEFLKGLIVEENKFFSPHFHILFYKPESMDFNVFKYKMEQASNRLCSEDFKFDLSDSNLSNDIKNTLSSPCYNKFSKVTEIHENIGSYLTKDMANYYIINGRKFNRKNDHLELWVNFKNSKISSNRIIENNNPIRLDCFC
jgi:hypothetical protein